MGGKRLASLSPRTVPNAESAYGLDISRNTVARAACSEGRPRYAPAGGDELHAVGERLRALPAEEPELPAAPAAGHRNLQGPAGRRGRVVRAVTPTR